MTTINQKGGVGKTTLAVHVALAGRDAGLSVLLIDLDTQGSASVILTRDLSIADAPGGAERLFSDPERLDPIATPFEVALLHGHQHLDRVDREIPLEDAQPLRRYLTALPFDLVVIDTPPAVGTRHLAPLLWSDVVLTPLEPSSPSLQGLAQTQKALRRARRLNPRLRSAVAINRFIQSSSMQQHYLELLKARVELSEPYLTQRVHVAAALDAGFPVWRYGRADRDLRRRWLDFCYGVLP